MRVLKHLRFWMNLQFFTQVLPWLFANLPGVLGGVARVAQRRSAAASAAADTWRVGATRGLGGTGQSTGGSRPGSDVFFSSKKRCTKLPNSSDVKVDMTRKDSMNHLPNELTHNNSRFVAVRDTGDFQPSETSEIGPVAPKAMQGASSSGGYTDHVTQAPATP